MNVSRTVLGGGAGMPSSSLRSLILTTLPQWYGRFLPYVTQELLPLAPNSLGRASLSLYFEKYLLMFTTVPNLTASDELGMNSRVLCAFLNFLICAVWTSEKSS